MGFSREPNRIESLFLGSFFFLDLQLGLFLNGSFRP